MNRIQKTLNDTGKVYKQLYEIDRSVNNDRLRNACVRVIFKYYEKKCSDIRYIEKKYDEIESINTQRNTHNKWREKVQFIYKVYGLNPKEKKQFVSYICKELQDDIEEDFVIGWKTGDYLNKNITSVQKQKNETCDVNDFYAIIYDHDGSIIHNATKWNLYN